MESISTLLKRYNLRPKKGLGQNFLVDPVHLAKIVETAGLTPQDIVLEIGPGPGPLTRLLAEAAGQVIAVELDAAMVTLLRHELAHLPNLTIVQADILQVDIPSLLQQPTRPPSAKPLLGTADGRPPQQDLQPPTLTQNSKLKTQNSKLPPYKVVANLPYYITSAVLRHVLETVPPPERVVVTVQKEVAQRMVAGPGQMSLLAVSVQFYGQPKLVSTIPAGAFYPPPQVDSAVVQIDTFPGPPIPVADVDQFFRVVKAGFGQKRKQLKNSLTAGLRLPAGQVAEALSAAGVEPTRRAETLSLAEWGRLVEELRMTDDGVATEHAPRTT